MNASAYRLVIAILAVAMSNPAIAAKPLIPGDYSDPDVIRVGTNYYMVTSSFQMSPGVPVLRSCDLKNWDTVAHAVPDLYKFSPKYGPDQMRMYGKGIYAPSIREHNGKFYVYVPSVDEGIIVSVADTPEGPWKADWLRKPDGTPWKEGRWSDPCPFWENGEGWIAMSGLARNWTGWLFKLSDDGMQLLDEGWCFSPYRSTEGHKIYKRGDWYYLFHIEFLKDGHGEGSYFLRSKDINGPYEIKYVPLSIPGQGALVDDTEGCTWWIAQFNTPKEPIGRAPYICPVEWKDGWPEIGEPTDAFAGGGCDQAWQCNHVCEEGAWDFVSRPGWFRINGRKGKDFFRTPNVACKRVVQYKDETVIAVDIDTSRLKEGEEAGLALFNGGKDYAVCKGVPKDGLMHCEWRISGDRCRSNDGQEVTIRGANYRGINWGLYTTGSADFKIREDRSLAVCADFDIRDYGAEEGGTRSCASAFAKAIDECAAKGGGCVVVPQGKWLTGAIHFKSNVELHLEDGAEIVFTDNPADYLPVVRTTWEDFECMNYSPLVYAYGCTNIALTGKGTLAPRMGTWRKWFKQPKSHFDAMAFLYHAAATNMPVEARNMAEFPGANMRPNLIQFNRCKGVRLEGYSIRESPMWCQHILLCDDVTVRGVSVYAHGFNNDGIDIDGSSNVLVEDCDFDQGDDVVVIKALRNQDGWRIGKPVENVVVRNCRVKEGHALLAVGSEISGGVRNILIENCTMSGRARNLIYLKTNRRRGGFIENITARNITADAADSVVAIDTDIFYHWAKLPDYETCRTPISGLDVSDVQVKEANYAVRINGDANLPVRGVKVARLRVDKVAKESISVKNAHYVSIELE